MDCILIKTEADLCNLFMGAMAKVPGWTCHPEAAGFDILVVHEDGRQIGVEAKLALNAKVADQILPEHWEDYYGKPGPDHRLVIVSKVTDASKGIIKMLEMLGVTVLLPNCMSGEKRGFDLRNGLFLYEQSHFVTSRPRMFDWSPAERCQVPMVVTTLPAGVPAPVQLTPWKEAALRVIALMRAQGFITAKQIASFGISTSAWTQHTRKHAWLVKGTVRGTWLETEHMPAFDKQHPDAYALAVEQQQAKHTQQLELTA